MKTLNLETEYLKAALNCVSTEASRFYLCGVCVTYNPSQGVVYYDATDGHVAFAARRELYEEANEEAGAEGFQIIIPTDAIKTALKVAGTKAQNISLIVSDEYRLGAIAFEPIDGSFPDVSRIAPKEISGETALFNPAKMLQCQKALCGAGKYATQARIGHNGNGPALMTGMLADAYCLIMPFRGEFLTTGSIPSWATTSRDYESKAEIQAAE